MVVAVVTDFVRHVEWFESRTDTSVLAVPNIRTGPHHLLFHLGE